MHEKTKLMQAVLDKVVDGKRIFGTSFAAKKGDAFWLGSSGNISDNQPYFIASVTKLFTTAITLHLKFKGKLNLNDTIGKYLDSAILNGLHLHENKEHSSEITIKHLLSHTSGLPDYFSDKIPGGISLKDDLLSGNDQFCTFEQAIERTKTIHALFAPGAKNKAHYSDANFQLLGKIIETITGKTYSENCAELVAKPLGISNTYVYRDPADTTPKTLYYKSRPLAIPKAMSSNGPDGGMVSTSTDMLTFIEAFFTGKLFPSAYINDLQEWINIFFPMQSGIGIHKFKLPWIFNPTGAVPYFIGHSGLSGALAFYSPRENLYVAGTVNQIAHPDISFKTMIKLTQILTKNRT